MGRPGVTQATTEPEAPTLAPKPRSSGKQRRARLAPSPTRLPSQAHARPCSVCGQHLTPPGASPQSPQPDSQTHPRKQTPATSSRNREVPAPPRSRMPGVTQVQTRSQGL